MKRSELYDRIWSTPASKIAEELGISGSRVAAICKRHGVPTPPRGYWAKIGVGKHVPKTPLPQPEADYELNLRTPDRKPAASAWVAPGVLHRPDSLEPPPAPRAVPLNKLQPAAAWPFPPAAATSLVKQDGAAQASAVDVDLGLVRAAAVELHEMRAIRNLLQAVATRALTAHPEEAHRILTWAAVVRSELDERDPVPALLRLVMQAGSNG